MRITDKTNVRDEEKLAALIIFQIFYTIEEKSSGLP